MSSIVPSLKVSGSGSGDKNRRTVIGVVQDFIKSEGSEEFDTIAVKVISPNGKMDGKVAHISLEDIGEEGSTRTSIATRVPGKTEKVPDPMNKGKQLDAPLKTDFNPGATVVRFDQAYFSAKGDGSDDTPYQMKARWSSTFSPEESRAMPVESAYITSFGKDGKTSYRVVAPMPSQSILIPAKEAANAAAEIANATRQEGGRSMGMTALLISDGEATNVFQVRTFSKYNEKAENKADRTTVPDGGATFNEAAKKAGVTFSDGDSFVIIPHQNFTVTDAKYMEPKHIKSWDALSKLTVKDGEAHPRASVIALSPNGIATNIAPVGPAHNFIEQAMVHVGLIERDQSENKSATTMDDPVEKAKPALDDEHYDNHYDEGMSPNDY